MIKRRQPALEIHRSRAMDLGDVQSLGSAAQPSKGSKKLSGGLALASESVGGSVPKAASTKTRNQSPSYSGNIGGSFGRAPRTLDPEKCGPAHAYSKAVAALASRESSTRSLFAKLTRLGFAREVIEVTIERLTQEKLLCDARFANSRTSSLANRRRGPKMVQAKLYGAGVSKELISESISAADVDWLTHAHDALVRKFGEVMPSERTEQAKRQRFLISRGFEERTVRAAMSKLKKSSV